jgi:hypothetical protein
MKNLPPEACHLCPRYLREAGLAIRDHLRAIAALELAVRDDKPEPLDALLDAVREASMARENAVANYEKHAATHAGMTAASAR